VVKRRTRISGLPLWFLAVASADKFGLTKLAFVFFQDFSVSKRRGERVRARKRENEKCDDADDVHARRPAAAVMAIYLTVLVTIVLRTLTHTYITIVFRTHTNTHIHVAIGRPSSSFPSSSREMRCLQML
jgi:hypothetical protein